MLPRMFSDKSEPISLKNMLYQVLCKLSCEQKEENEWIYLSVSMCLW